MSRIGLYHGKRVTFTHRNPQTGDFWTEELGGGRWVNSNEISFDLDKPKKRKSRFRRKER